MMSTPKVKLRMSERFYTLLHSHLFPGDGLEAVAVALCGVSEIQIDGVVCRLASVHQVYPIDYDKCERAQEYVSWNTVHILPLLMSVPASSKMTFLKIHSHPTDYPRFSEIDDRSDQELFPGIAGWLDTEFPGISAVMLSNGSIFGRAFDDRGAHVPLHSVSIAGSDIRFWPTEQKSGRAEAYLERSEQLFGKETTKRLAQLSIAVIGTSGTGSPVAEMLHRLGVGELVLVDDDRVEERNLNRIYYATMEDARQRNYKVDVLARAFEQVGLPTKVIPIRESLFHPDVVRRVAQCDVVFGCMDAADGRMLLNLLASFYCIPYFDLGVRLEADGNGGIDAVDASVHYLKPGGSNLLHRRAITNDQIQSDTLFRTNKDEYNRRLKQGYIKGSKSAVGSPSVISVNTMIASIAINDFLARLHPFRMDDNKDIATLRISFHNSLLIREPEGTKEGFTKWIGLGDVKPLLYVPELSVGTVL